MHLSQVVAETGDLLIGLAPMLGLTCKSFYEHRVLKSLGAEPVCLKHVTRPVDGCRVAVSNVAVHVPALAESADRLSAVRWELDFLELRAFLDGRPEWPAALKDVEVVIRAPDVAAGIAFVKDFGPERLHVAVFDDMDTVRLTGVDARQFARVFGDCEDVASVLRACLTPPAKAACEGAWASVHMGNWDFESFDALEDSEAVDDWSNNMFWQSLRDD